MFERYTEQARRVIFFARYEASQYGSRLIETEHLLLGVLREHGTLIPRIPGETVVGVGERIRAEIEKRIPRAHRISTSVEVPLSRETAQTLKSAVETADRLGHRHVAPGHLLVGLLLVETSMAAQILRSRGLAAETVQFELAKAQGSRFLARASANGQQTLEAFLAGLKSLKPDDLILSFANNAEFIDADGKLWGHEEIWRKFDTLFAPYAKRNAMYAIESTLANTEHAFVATVLWKNELLASEQRTWQERMSVVLTSTDDEWEIVLIQVTSVQPS